MITSVYAVTLTCDRADDPRYTQRCPDLALELTEPSALSNALAAKKWTERDGRHFCPRHNPDEEGQFVLLPLMEYAHLGRGVWARARRDCLDILNNVLEVQLRDGLKTQCANCADTEASRAQWRDWALHLEATVGRAGHMAELWGSPGPKAGMGIAECRTLRACAADLRAALNPKDGPERPRAEGAGAGS